MNTILTIAGSDSCAGAGIQIDMKTAAAHGVHATCAITAITAQNTREVSAVQMTRPEVLRAQIEAIWDDMPPQAVKVGMLGTAEIASCVADCLAEHPGVPVVVDPVLVATAGAELTSAEAFEAIRSRLVPLATIVTPNLPEAIALTGIQDVQGAAQRFLELGAAAVLVKGGHADGPRIEDLLCVGGGEPASHVLEADRIPGEFHGTGCSISSAIACNLAAGASVVDAVFAAHAYLQDALRHEVGLGRGTKVFNPLNRIERPYGTQAGRQ